tara:strand:+ start:17135 stop:17320 length:186 start_codon:yes stop_codon:yes gene_type:complete
MKNKRKLLEWFLMINIVVLGALVGFGIKKYYNGEPVDLSYLLNSVILIVGGFTAYYHLIKK